MTAPNAVLNVGSNATLNADVAELDKFAALAHHWWDAGGELATLHHINPLRLDWIDAQRPLQGARVLDVGCGGGILADAMARKGAEVLGIDLAEKSLQAARLHALEAETPRVSYRAVAAEALGLADLTNTIKLVHANLNRDLRLIGLLRVMFDPRITLQQQVSDQLKRHYGDRVFDTVIPRNVRLAEAPSYGLPGIVFDSHAKGSQAFIAFAHEMVQRGLQA